MHVPEFLISGCGTRPGVPRTLRAGPLTLGFIEGELRNVRLRGQEVIDRVYAAVRDENWATLIPVVSDVQIDDQKEAFSIRFRAEHRHEDVHFTWQGQITGEPDGTIRFEFDGQALTTFHRNRIGICLLHPLTVAGAGCRIERADGTVADTAFPTTIAREQPIDGFTDIAALTHEVAPGVRLEARFTGELFETEDQRNWIDASFKTYSTPLRLSRSVEIKAGTQVRQTVTLRLMVERANVESSDMIRVDSVHVRETRRDESSTDPIRIDIDRSSPRPLPKIGLTVHDFEMTPASEMLAGVEFLRLSHLRVELHLGRRASADGARRKLAMAAELSLPVELTLHIPADGRQHEAKFAELVAGHRLCRVLAVQDGYPSTTAQALETLRSFGLNSEVLVGAGTTVDLAELNLFPPVTDGADYIAWSMNPQCHALDNFSLVETPAAAREQVLSVGRYYPGLPLVVSPITFKPRPPVHEPKKDHNPRAEVDPRQWSLLGAAWTLAMLSSLAATGTEAATFFETAGSLGVMARGSEAERSRQFPVIPGSVFPMYHIFAALAGFNRCLPTISNSPGVIAVLALQNAKGGERLIIANLSPMPAHAEASVLRYASCVRRLDEATVMNAMEHPSQFWSEAAELAAGCKSDRLVLGPYAIAIIDLTSSI